MAAGQIREDMIAQSPIDGDGPIGRIFDPSRDGVAVARSP